MELLERLPEDALGLLAMATEWPGSPPARTAPNFWEAFADLVAHEVGCRRGVLARDQEPRFPDVSPAELEGAAVALLGMAAGAREAGDVALSELLSALAAGVVALRKLAGATRH